MLFDAFAANAFTWARFIAAVAVWGSGLEIEDEVLEHFSPFRTEHINRLGIFQLNIDKAPMDLEYNLVEKIKE